MLFPPLSSIRGKLLVALVTLQVTLFVIFSVLTSATLREAAARNLEVNSAQTAEIINLALTPYSAGGQLNSLQEFFDELIRQSGDGIVYLVVEDSNGKRLLAAGEMASGLLPPPSAGTSAAIDTGIYHHRQKILLGGNEVGHAQFGLATGNVIDLLRRLTGSALWLGGFVIAVITSLAILAGSRINQRLQEFMRNLNSIASGHYEEKLPTTGADELSQLAGNINRMADAVWLRERTFASVFNAAPVPMTLMRFDTESGRYLIDNMNTAALKIIERRLEDVVGKDGQATGTRIDEESRHRLVESITQTPGSIIEMAITDGQGRRLECLASGQIFDVFGVRYMITAIVDISQLRATEAALRELNMHLEQRVEERTQALNERNDELASAVENLRQAQAKLVQAEKLSSLGGIVAAVAHELNTPIGNALTVATTQQAHLAQFRATVAQGLTRSAMQRHLDGSDEGITLLVRNLERAAELVASFKEVAVDRTSSQRRRFDLATVVDEIVLTLLPTLRQTPFIIEKNIPEGLLCDSYPGPLGQIIANLINNATTHAFQGRDHGTVVIEAAYTGASTLRLSIRDDGCGIPKENLGRVFDPFFTTRLGHGGSGLGLHIVYNLVTGLLGGVITVESETGAGTRFHIDLPLVAPENDAGSDVA